MNGRNGVPTHFCHQWWQKLLTTSNLPDEELAPMVRVLTGRLKSQQSRPELGLRRLIFQALWRWIKFVIWRGGIDVNPPLPQATQGRVWRPSRCPARRDASRAHRRPDR